MNPIHAIAIIIGWVILLTFYLTMIRLYTNRNMLDKQKTAEPLSPWKVDSEETTQNYGACYDQ